jgi:hypothetical protein
VQGVGAGGQVDSRADRGHGAQRRLAAPLPGQLQHQVAAHRVARQRHSLQAEPLRIMAHHHAHIGRESGVIERGRQRLRAAAGAHVHAHHVPAGLPRRVRRLPECSLSPTSLPGREPAPKSAVQPGPARPASGNGTARGCHPPGPPRPSQKQSPGGMPAGGNNSQQSFADGRCSGRGAEQTRETLPAIRKNCCQACIFFDFQDHKDSVIEKVGACGACANGAARGDRTLDILCHRQAFCH